MLLKVAYQLDQAWFSRALLARFDLHAVLRFAYQIALSVKGCVRVVVSSGLGFSVQIDETSRLKLLKAFLFHIGTYLIRLFSLIRF